MTGYLPAGEESLLRERFETVCARLEKAASASGRAIRDIRLVAVSKMHPAPMVAALAAIWSEGPPTFGENYVQEAIEKQTAVASLLSGSPARHIVPEWHFTGHVQTRKAKDVVGKFRLIHTLDSVKFAEQIQKAVQARNLPPQEVLVQVNIGEESQKSGVTPDAAEALMTSVMRLPEVRIVGLMCLPPLFGEAETSRPYFVKLRKIRDTLASATGLALPHLSMGMSHDCEVAIAEGATMVRVGTDIFGSRPPKQSG